MDLQWIGRIWTQSADVEWWLMLIIGFILLLCNIILFLVMWFARQNVVIEFGYPKRNRKYMKKILSNHSFIQNLLLYKVTIEAEKKGPLLYINIACHWLNISALICSLIGFIACLITCVDGWAIVLLLAPVITVLFFSIVIEFIPHLIWLPSERSRYKFK